MVEDVRAQSDSPVVVTSYLPLGRIAWAEVLAGEDWTLVDEDGHVLGVGAHVEPGTSHAEVRAKPCAGRPLPCGSGPNHGQQTGTPPLMALPAW